MSIAQRFDEAIEMARTLPPTLLSKDHKLKLFALFKQADGPAPLKAPENVSELEVVKERDRRLVPTAHRGDAALDGDNLNFCPKKNEKPRACASKCIKKCLFY